MKISVISPSYNQVRVLPAGAVQLLQEQVIQLQVNALEIEIEHVYNSNSYRITKPMRDFRRWVGTKRIR